MNSSIESGSEQTLGVAIFDLDGTLTYHDTLVPFLGLAVAANPARLLRLAAAGVWLARYLIDRDRGRLKGALIQALVGGCTRAQIDALAQSLIVKLLRNGLRPGAQATLQRHRERGDRLILLSASPDLYVPAIAKALSFDQCLCTQVLWRGEHLMGSLITENRRGEEKRRLVADLLAELKPPHSAAYGNAESDLPHLRLVTSPLLVNANAHARKKAEQYGVPTDEWP